jgi:hypothetical protein
LEDLGVAEGLGVTQEAVVMDQQGVQEMVLGVPYAARGQPMLTTVLVLGQEEQGAREVGLTVVMGIILVAAYLVPMAQLPLKR